MWDTVYPYVAALVPTIGILVLFYIVIRSVMEADRRERRAQAQWEAARSREEDLSQSQSERARSNGDRPSTDPGPEDN
ncbi:MAG: hypothetical protein WCG47_01115 [Dermatophilaceae bacterium]